MLEKIRNTNLEYTDLFIMSISMHGDQPIVQGYYEGHVAEGSPEPASLNIGSEVLSQLHKAMSPDEDDEDEEDDEDGDETRH